MRWGIWILLGLLFLTFMPTASAAASCNAIDITPDHVFLTEDKENRTLTMKIVNDADDDFDIKEIKVEESDSKFNISVDDFPDEVGDNSEENITFKYDTFDVNGDYGTSFNVSVRGEFEDDEVVCSFNALTFTVDVTIEDSQDVCQLVAFETSDVFVSENNTITHTVYLRNDSGQKFTLQDFDVFDDSPEFSATLDVSFDDEDFSKEILSNQKQSYKIKIKTQNVSEDITDTTYLEVRGEFEDGTDCGFNDVDGEFDVTVENTASNAFVCTELKLLPTHFDAKANESISQSLFLQNNSEQDFFVDEFVIADSNYQLDFEILGTPDKIPFEEVGEFTLEGIGYNNSTSFEGNAFVSIQGHFTDSTSCYISNVKVPFTYVGTQGVTCNDFDVVINPLTLLKENQTLPIEFVNPLNKVARVQLSVDEGSVSPSLITIQPNTRIIQHVEIVSNAGENVLHVLPLVEGCSIEEKTSTVLFTSVTNAPIQLKNPPSELIVGQSPTFGIALKNQSAFTQEATIRLTVKPTGQVLEKTIQIGGFDEPIVLLPAALVQNGTLAIVQVESAGYIVTHTYQLGFENNVTVVPIVTKQPSAQNTYTVEVIVENTSNKAQEGQVVIEAPQGWVIEGNPNVNLAANEKQVVTFTVKPSKWLTSSQSVGVQFQGFVSQSSKQMLLLQPSSSPAAQATAFVTGSGGFWLGVLVILVILGVWWTTQKKAEEAPLDLASEDPIEWPQEVWMPKKGQ